VLRVEPSAKAARRRVVYGLLRLDRAVEALAEAQALHAQDPLDPRSERFLRAAQAFARRSAAPAARSAPIDALRREALVNGLSP